MVIEQKKLGKLGASEVGVLFTKEGNKSKTVQVKAFEKAKELIFGTQRELTTIAMQHGLFNEEEAYYSLIKPNFPDAVYRSSESIWINEQMWATPDVVDNVSGLTFDIKCPYTPYTFFNNVRTLSKGYLAQLQWQMKATGHKKGYVVFFLTSNRTDEYGNKVEYDIPLEDRVHWEEVIADNTFQIEIEQRIREFFPLRDLILSHIENVPILDDMEFFQLNKTKKVTRFKDKSNLTTWQDKIVYSGGEYYVIE